MSKNRISQRLSAIAPSATLAVTNKAKELKAQGKPVIGFGAGEPDFPTPDYIVQAGVQACQEPANHRYSANKGLPQLREAIAQKTQRDSGYQVDPDNILVTNGGKQAVYQAFAAIIDPGDEVLLPTPYWTTYPEAIKLAGGKTVEVFAGAEQGYKVSVEQLEAARSGHTKMLLMCSPCNPTGAVYTPEELSAIGQWALNHAVWIVTDEIYEHLVYDGAEPAHMIQLVPQLADTCIVLNGVAKSYAMTGWRVGWMTGPKDVIGAAANLQSHLTSNVCNVAQQAAAAALSGSLDAVFEMRAAFDRRHTLIVNMLSEIEGLVVPKPHGAFYVYPDVSALLGRSLRGTKIGSSAQLADLLLEHAEVAVVPGEAFGPGGFIRMSYALADQDLITGVTRLQEVLSEIK